MISESHIRQTIALLRAEAVQLNLEAERLERVLEPNDDRATFDPRTDTPPVVAKPKGTNAEEYWCTLLLFTGLLVHEVQAGRGATDVEARAIATAAGYTTGNNAWNGWIPAGTQNVAGLRSLDADGLVRIQRSFDEVGRLLPDDLVAAIEGRAL